MNINYQIHITILSKCSTPAKNLRLQLSCFAGQEPVHQAKPLPDLPSPPRPPSVARPFGPEDQPRILPI